MLMPQLTIIHSLDLRMVMYTYYEPLLANTQAPNYYLT
jgi:hypothetical protein